MRLWLLFFFTVASIGQAAPRHCRDCSCLPAKEQEFAAKLSVAKRKIFCGKFTDAQRQSAMRYSAQCTEDKAVVKVMQESGMSLAVKSKKELTARSP